MTVDPVYLKKYLLTLAAYLEVPMEDVRIISHRTWLPSKEGDKQVKLSGSGNQARIPILLSKGLAFPGCCSREGKKDVLQTLETVDQFRSLKGTCYKRALVRFPTLLTTKALQVPSDKLEKLGTLLLLCKRKIRIIDFDSREVTSILLDGVPDAYLQHELSIRSVFSKSINIPKIRRLSLMSSPKFYLEEFIHGHSLRRWELREDTVQDNIAKLFKQLWYLYKTESLQESVPFMQYVEALMEQITSDFLFAINPIRSVVHSAYREIYKMNAHRSLPQTMELCLAHGDLNTDNLLLRKGELFLLDWENTRTLSIFHDFINFHVLASRYLGRRLDIRAIADQFKAFDLSNGISEFPLHQLETYVYLWILEKAAFDIVLPDLRCETRDMTRRRRHAYQNLFTHVMK